ncbi:MAG: ribosome maturation factor RimM [Actinomycetes bacterium]
MTRDTHPADGDLVLVGRVVKPHGIRGEVAVDVLSDVDGRFAPGAELTGRGRTWVVETSRPHQGRALVRFEGVPDRTAAEALRGLTLHAPPAADLDDALFWAHELVGLEVVHGDDGRLLGVVADLVELPPAAGYDLLEVVHEGRTWLLPAVDELVEVEELDGGGYRLVVVDPPEGLVDGEPVVVRAPDEPDPGPEPDA